MIHDDALTYRLHQGTAPLLVSIPHMGTALPDEVRAQFTQIAALLQDTDWHLDRLYGFAFELGASVLQAKVSRYAVDLNRPPNDQSLYPGQTTTGLCPTETFRGEPLYAAGVAPDAAERGQRLERYWRPYHEALRSELDRLLAVHGRVLLWDAHSIAGELPRLFAGHLPDLNFGTADGHSCAPALIDTVRAVLHGRAPAHEYTDVLNGRFKGGYITRHYGDPTRGVHAIQLEMSQHIYMREAPPFDYLPEAAARLQPVLRAMLEAALKELSAVGSGLELGPA